MNSINSIKRYRVRIIVATPTRGYNFKAAITLTAMASFCFGLLTGFALAAAWLVS